ncbi:kazal-type serine protease inhibitor, putative [Phytophthora infestans T30-4]|uniref:Kazal-type serine protease inhibitor, putative n=1 Tax=Phytophthora infestans (strain T30-4) TaxID=403677 RepID=D0NJ47_PHYIT|nr:kazal-type serine protease inhibitor, putative [Phytophthora infestans T30-4]EEY59565.1 kazal-type serine protease inhibitor, putative [Phytophthora infestans T30-4]|eukprot:XP_002900758.1 kazal-type serine protease inhibitor, putative [Phytophthora infestans T30-4]
MKLAVGLVLAAVAAVAVSAGDPATLSTKEEATKTTKTTKSEKTGTAPSSGIGSLFADGSNGVIGDESAAGVKTDPKLLKSIGIMGKDGSGGLNLGPGPAVYPSDSGSWDWSWDSIEGSGSSHYDCDTECPDDFNPVCGSDHVTYTNDCAFTVAQCNATELVVANSGECAKSSSGSNAESCPDACTMEYSPVTDENGKKYSNECAMRLAKCKGEAGEEKKIVTFAALDETTDEKGAKETPAPASKTTKATKSEKTGTASGSGIGALFEDGSNGVIGSEDKSGSADPTLVKGTKETPAPASKITKATKAEKTGTASGSGIGALFEDGSNGVIGSEDKSGSADPTLVKGTKETPAPASKTTKATKSEKTGTASGSGIGALFEDGSNGVIGSESASADPTSVKGVKPVAEKTVPQRLRRLCRKF